MAHQRGYGYRHRIGAIGIEARMRFGADRHALRHLQVEQDLIGVEGGAEIPERWPLHAAVRRLAPIGIEDQMAVLGADVELEVVGIKQLDAILRAFRERYAMPDLLTRTI